MKSKQYKFSNKKELEAILDKIDKEVGFEPMPPCLGHLDIWYKIKDREFKGGTGVFVGQSPEEQVEEFRRSAIRALGNCALDARHNPIDDADLQWGQEILALLERCSNDDVCIVDWTYRANDN